METKKNSGSLGSQEGSRSLEKWNEIHPAVPGPALKYSLKKLNAENASEIFLKKKRKEKKRKKNVTFLM